MRLRLCNLNNLMKVLVLVSRARLRQYRQQADSTPELTATSPTSDGPSSSTSYSCDLGLWPADVLDSMREYWAAKGSGDCNNSDAQSWKLIRRLSNNFQNVPPSPYTMLMCA